MDTKRFMRQGDSLIHVRSANEEVSSISVRVNLHTKRGTHWVSFAGNYYIDS